MGVAVPWKGAKSFPAVAGPEPSSTPVRAVSPGVSLPLSRPHGHCQPHTPGLLLEGSPLLARPVPRPTPQTGFPRSHSRWPCSLVALRPICDVRTPTPGPSSPPTMAAETPPILTHPGGCRDHPKRPRTAGRSARYFCTPLYGAHFGRREHGLREDCRSLFPAHGGQALSSEV